MMAAMAPEAISAAGGAVAGRAFSPPDTQEGSPVAFMVAIILLGLSFIGLYLAFHNPAEWDLSGGQWPGLFARILGFAQAKGTGQATGAGTSTSSGAQQSTSGAAAKPGVIQQAEQNILKVLFEPGYGLSNLGHYASDVLNFDKSLWHRLFG